MKYVTKLGAYGLAVAAAFAVALAVLVSVSPTPATEAAIHERASDGTFSENTDADANAVNNGDTVYIQNDAAGFVLYEIEALGNASASFTHSSAENDRQTLYCLAVATTATAPTCDLDIPGGGSTVAVKIDSDSGVGGIIVKQTVLATGVTTADELVVSVAPVPTKLTANASPKAVNAGEGAATAGESTLTFRLTDQNGNGIGDQRLTIIASHGTLTALGTAPTAWTDATGGITFSGTGTQVGTVTTSTDGGAGDADGAGHAAVTFTAGGVSGTATITARVVGSTLAQTVDVTMYGAAKTITAEPEQSALQVGGSTFIVVTVTDAGGNAVANHNVAVKSGASGVVGPSRDANEVGTSNEVNKNADPVATLTGTDLPACGDVTAVPDTSGADKPSNAVAGSTGTNSAGKCVIQVTTAGADTATTADDTTRGSHTITIAGPAADGSADVTVEIEIGGAPATITSDAPERIAPGEEVTINVTVVDDEGVRVGAVAIEAIKTDGGGLITTPISAMTSDGRAKFAYLAPSRAGAVDLLVRTKNARGVETARLPITIQIGEAEPEAPPEPDDPHAGDAHPELSGSGALRIFNGGSVADLAHAAEDACPGGADIWLQDGDSWLRYSTVRPPFTNAPFEAAFAGGLEMQAVFVSDCQEDGMGDEGDGMGDGMGG